MTPQAQIKALAELDGWEVVPDGIVCEWELTGTPPNWGDTGTRYHPLPNYLTSWDAILPVIRKQDILQSAPAIPYQPFLFMFHKCLLDLTWTSGVKSETTESVYIGCLALHRMLTATPAQLCEALLKATNKWKE